MRVMKNRSLSFYLEGRHDIAEKGCDAEVDLERLCEQILEGDLAVIAHDVYEITHAAASAALGGATLSRVRAKWVAKNRQNIGQSGVTENEAWDAYHAGRVAEYRHLLEDELVDELDEQLDDAGGVDEDEESDED